MVTHGSVNLDVDDNYGPHDWPLVSDVTLDMLRYSVHFPLQPMVRMLCSFTCNLSKTYYVCSVNSYPLLGD